jgi:hypothetical protein
MTKLRHTCVAAACAILIATMAAADEQVLAPGTGVQDATVIDTGANGTCETTATPDDIQATLVGHASPNQKEIKCGMNKVAETAAHSGGPAV